MSAVPASGPTVTAAAEAFMRRLVRLSGRADAGFRLVVTPGGCSGYMTAFSVEPPQPGDTAVDIHGLRLVLPAASPLLGPGMTVDFADTPTQTGLVVLDAAPRECYCGAHPPRAGHATVPVDAVQPRPRP